MKCYVINLARAPDRLEHIRRVFGAAGIAFERFEAIDGAAARAHPDAARVPPMRDRPWTDGEFACLMSHYSVWKLIADGPDSHGAVFEDDIHIDPRLKTVLDHPNMLPAEADVIKLETVLQKTAVARSTVEGAAGVQFARLKATHYGAGAYILSRDLARRLVGSAEQLDVPADDLLFGFHHPFTRTLRPYQLIPALAVQDSVLVLAGSKGSDALASLLEPERVAPQAAKAAELEAAGPMRVWRKLRAMGRWLVHGLVDRTLIVPFGRERGTR